MNWFSRDVLLLSSQHLILLLSYLAVCFCYLSTIRREVANDTEILQLSEHHHVPPNANLEQGQMTCDIFSPRGNEFLGTLLLGVSRYISHKPYRWTRVDWDHHWVHRIWDSTSPPRFIKKLRDDFHSG
jgi:hypothetical protein